MSQKFDILHQKLKKIADVENAAALLNWDQETHMPEMGAGFRAQQLATLSGISHELFLDPELEKSLKELEEEKGLSEIQRRNVDEVREDLDKKKKYSTEFVEKLSRKTSEAFQAWQKAKKEDDFQVFAPALKELVDLKKKECELLGYGDHPYDALIDQFEPGMSTKDVDNFFHSIKGDLKDLIDEIKGAPPNDDPFMYRHYPEDKQWEFGLECLKAMGYDMNKGRQDLSTHPFTISFSPEDVRVTTRIDANDLNEMIWSCIHEGGHALYEQGLLKQNYGLPAGEAASLGIHESQARLWENIVGRGKSFWKNFFPRFKEYFQEQTKDVELEDFYKGMNMVKSSLIRTNADELTYHFHIMIRFEIEKAMIEGSIAVEDIPELWNGKYKEYLDIDVPSDQKGCLQDIHWSHGGIGYFPTYSLGSFYSAQFYAKAKKDVPELEDEIGKGNLKPLLNWLRENIHCHGRLYKAPELVERVTGGQPDPSYFMEYARGKFSGIYSLEQSESA